MGRPLLLQILHVLLFSLLIFALCAWPAWAWGGAEGLAALAAAAGICFVGAAIGRLAADLLQRLDPTDEAGPRAVQAAIGVRMVVTLVATLPVFLWKTFPTFPFVVWLGTNYLAHLALEVFVSLRHLGQNAAPSGEVGSPAASIDLSDQQSRDDSSSGVAEAGVAEE